MARLGEPDKNPPTIDQHIRRFALPVEEAAGRLTEQARSDRFRGRAAEHVGGPPPRRRPCPPRSPPPLISDCLAARSSVRAGSRWRGCPAADPRHARTAERYSSPVRHGPRSRTPTMEPGLRLAVLRPRSKDPRAAPGSLCRIDNPLLLRLRKRRRQMLGQRTGAVCPPVQAEAGAQMALPPCRAGASDWTRSHGPSNERPVAGIHAHMATRRGESSPVTAQPRGIPVRIP